MALSRLLENMKMLADLKLDSNSVYHNLGDIAKERFIKQSYKQDMKTDDEFLKALIDNITEKNKKYTNNPKRIRNYKLENPKDRDYILKKTKQFFDMNDIDSQTGNPKTNEINNNTSEDIKYDIDVDRKNVQRQNEIIERLAKMFEDNSILQFKKDPNVIQDNEIVKDFPVRSRKYAYDVVDNFRKEYKQASFVRDPRERSILEDEINRRLLKVLQKEGQNPNNARKYLKSLEELYNSVPKTPEQARFYQLMKKQNRIGGKYGYNMRRTNMDNPHAGVDFGYDTIDEDLLDSLIYQLGNKYVLTDPQRTYLQGKITRPASKYRNQKDINNIINILENSMLGKEFEEIIPKK